MNKAGGGDGIQTELFQILKDDAVKVLHSICQQIWKTQQWPFNLKKSVFIPVPKKGNANVPTTALLDSSHTLAKYVQKSPKQATTVYELRTSRCSSWIYKRQRNQRSTCQHPLAHRKARVFQKKIYFYFIDYAKAFNYVDHNKLENSERDGNTRPPDLPLEKSVCRSGSNSQKWTQNIRLVPNRKRSTSRLYIVTLLI